MLTTDSIRLLVAKAMGGVKAKACWNLALLVPINSVGPPIPFASPGGTVPNLGFCKFALKSNTTFSSRKGLCI
jgi:hypothetical protein